MSRPRAAPRNRRARISQCRRTRCQAQPRLLHQVYPPHASTSLRSSKRLRSSAGEPIIASAPRHSNHVHPSAHHLWLANNTATLLRVEMAKEPERVHRHGLTPAFSTRQESSALAGGFGEPYPLGQGNTRRCQTGDQYRPTAPGPSWPAASQRRINRFVVFFFESRDQFGGGPDFADAADALAAAQISFQAFGLARSPDASV